MASLIALLILLSGLAIPVALIRPRLILRTSANPSRLKALAITLAVFIVMLFGGAEVLRHVLPEEPAPAKENHAENSKPVASPSAPPAVQPVPAVAAPANNDFPPVTADDIPAVDPGKAGEDDPRIIAIDNGAFAMAIRSHAPRLDKTGEERRREVVVETYVSAPSHVRLVLDTLPSQPGIRPGSAAVIRAAMERPLADKPSPYGDGLAKTIDAFVFVGAPDWPTADRKAFVGECLMTLVTSGCDRTVKGVRVLAKRYGTDAFRIEVYRP